MSSMKEGCFSLDQTLVKNFSDILDDRTCDVENGSKCELLHDKRIFLLCLRDQRHQLKEPCFQVERVSREYLSSFCVHQGANG